MIDQAGYGATAAAPVVRPIFSYLAAHPVDRSGHSPCTGHRASRQRPSRSPTTPATDHHHAGASTAAERRTATGHDPGGRRPGPAHRRPGPGAALG